MPNFAGVNTSPLNASGIVPVSIQVGSAYTSLQSLGVTSTYTVILGLTLTTSYSYNSPMSLGTASSYGVTTPISVGVVITYGTTLQASIQVSSLYNVTNTLPVGVSIMGVYAQLGRSHVNVTNSTTVTISGKIVPIIDININTQEGAAMWRGTVTLSSPSDYLAVLENDKVTISIYGDVYNLIVDAKSRSIQGVNSPRYTLQCISPAAQYASPRATLITKNWVVATLVSDIAKEVIPSLVWTAFDWVMLSGKFSVTQASPLSIVTNLAAIVGASVNVTLTGAIVVEPKYKIRPKFYSTTPSHHTLTDVTDILTLSESGAFSKLANNIRLSDTAIGFSDSIEFIGDRNSKNSGELRLRLYPYRSNYILKHSRNTDIAWTTSMGVVTQETITEVLPVINGVATASKPVLSLTSSIWMSEPLGIMTALGGTNEIRSSLGGTSLASVTYTSRYISFRVLGVVGEASLYYVENI